MTILDPNKKYRVLNLIKKANPDKMTIKRWAVISLLQNQPEAVQIRFEGRCHCRGLWLMSYRLPTLEDMRRREHEEDCGYFCPNCGFSNAGSRPKRLRPDETETEDRSR